MSPPWTPAPKGSSQNARLPYGVYTRAEVAMGGVGFAVVLGALALTSCAQFEARALTGTFLFEAGHKVALELTGENPCPCYCGTIELARFSVREATGSEIHLDQSQSCPVAAGAWIGRWDPTSDGVPVSMYLYALAVETSLGTFQAEVRVVVPGAAPVLWVEAEASVCGMGLRVYRLVEEGDGPAMSLRVGEYLLVALPGNPTTGYDWEVKETPTFLSPVEGPGYGPLSGLIGRGDVLLAVRGRGFTPRDLDPRLPPAVGGRAAGEDLHPPGDRPIAATSSEVVPVQSLDHTAP